MQNGDWGIEALFVLPKDALGNKILSSQNDLPFNQNDGSYENNFNEDLEDGELDDGEDVEEQSPELGDNPYKRQSSFYKENAI